MIGPMKRVAPAAIVLLLAVGIAFLPAFRAKYTNWDDPEYVGAARAPLPVLCTAFISGHFHPLTMLSLALDVRLFGMNPAEMHAVSIALHAVTSLLVLFLLFELTGSVRGALAGALFFAIHPLRVESAVWISERKDVLFGLFYVAGLLAYLAHLRRGLSIAWTVLLFVLSLLAKGTAITFPFAMLLIDFWNAADVPPPWRDSFAAFLRRRGGFFLLSVAGGVMAVVAQHSGKPLPERVHFTMFERLLLVCHSFLMHVAREIAPVNLSAFYRNPDSVQAIDWLSAAAVVILAIALIASLRRFPRVFTGGAFFAITLLPMLPLLQMGKTIAGDRYTYIPAVGLSLLVAAGVARLSIRIAAAVTAIGALLLGMLTWQRCFVWHDATTLWTSVIEYDPDTAVAWNNLGVALYADGDSARGFAALNRAVELDPCYLLALYNRAHLAFEGENDVERENRDIDRMLACDPGNRDALALRGRLLQKQRDRSRGPLRSSMSFG